MVKYTCRYFRRIEQTLMVLMWTVQSWEKLDTWIGQHLRKLFFNLCTKSPCKFQHNSQGFNKSIWGQLLYDYIEKHFGAGSYGVESKKDSICFFFSIAIRTLLTFTPWFILQNNIKTAKGLSAHVTIRLEAFYLHLQNFGFKYTAKAFYFILTMVYIFNYWFFVYTSGCVFI